MTPNFAGWAAFLGLIVIAVVVAMLVLRSRRPDIYNRVVGALQHKDEADPQPAVEPTMPPAEPQRQHVPIKRPPEVPSRLGGQIPPSPFPTQPPALSPASVASPPLAPAPSAVAAAGSGTPIQPERTAMSLTRSVFTSRTPPAPTAIQMLRNFKQVAALVQAFLDCPNELVKYCLYREEPMLRSIPRDSLGVSAGWINACSYDGLLDGVSVFQCSVDDSARTVSINGASPVPVTASSPANGWATGDGQPPDFYQPLGRVSKSGADIVADFLRQSAAGSQYLRNLGLTEEAIAAARA
jgi:hypothetical protein